MKRLVCVCASLAMLCALGAAAEPSLLPKRVGPWQADGPAKITSGENLYASEPKDVRSEVLREAGLRSIEERNYTNENGQLKLSVYTFKDPSAAYEFYTHLTAPGMTSAHLGEGSFFDAYHMSVLIGNLVLTTGPSRNLKPENLAGLAAALKAKADGTPFPPLKNYLPEKGRIYGSEKYALGPFAFRYAMDTLGQGAHRELGKELGFNSGVEAILAKYQMGREAGVLLLLEYPTPQLAEQHLHHLAGALPAAAKQAGVKVERKASMLSLVFAATSKEYDQALRDAVNYETEVTWNEPSHTATDPPIVAIMVKIFLFTGLFLGVATGVGIAFGGVRVIVKRLFPGKVFDRPRNIEILQLGLSGKKIDPTDMY